MHVSRIISTRPGMRTVWSPRSTASSETKNPRPRSVAIAASAVAPLLAWNVPRSAMWWRVPVRASVQPVPWKSVDTAVTARSGSTIDNGALRALASAAMIASASGVATAVTAGTPALMMPVFPAVTAVANPEALAIIAAEASARNAPLSIVDPDLAVTAVSTDFQGTGWTDARTGTRHHIALRGTFQASNGATALAAIATLRGRGFFVSDEAVERGLQTVRIPGRVEMIRDTCMVMLDGAHNAQKVEALAADVSHLLPVSPGGQRIAVLGVLEAKQALEMVKSLVPVSY